jgi:hypothetical protein
MREIARAIRSHGKSYGAKRFTNVAAHCSNAMGCAKIDNPSVQRAGRFPLRSPIEQIGGKFWQQPEG